jgi:hypothetical protein
VDSHTGERAILDAQARRELAALAYCDGRSIDRAYRGEKLRPTVFTRIARAALQLRLPSPPSQGGK